MVIDRLALMMTSLFATAPLVRTLFSVSLPVSLSAVAALSFPALFFPPTFVLPLPASTSAHPFGLPLFSVPLPVIFVPPVLSLSPALLIPGPLPLSASIFMVIPVLPPAPVIPTVSFFISAFTSSVPAAAATSSTFSPILVPVCAAGPSSFPVPSVPVSALPLLPLSVTLPFQLSIKTRAVAVSLTVVAPAP